MGLSYFEVLEGRDPALLAEAYSWVTTAFNSPGYWLFAELNGHSTRVTLPEALLVLGVFRLGGAKLESLWSLFEKKQEPEVEETPELLARREAFMADENYVRSQGLRPVDG